MVTSIERPRVLPTASAVRSRFGVGAAASTGVARSAGSTVGVSVESGERVARSTACGTIPGS